MEEIAALAAVALAAAAAALPWRSLATRDLNYQRGVHELWEGETPTDAAAPLWSCTVG